MAIRTTHVCDQCAKEASTPEHLLEWSSVVVTSNGAGASAFTIAGFPATMNTSGEIGTAPVAAFGAPRTAEVCGLTCGSKWLAALAKEAAAQAKEAKAKPAET